MKVTLRLAMGDEPPVSITSEWDPATTTKRAMLLELSFRLLYTIEYLGQNGDQREVTQ